MYKKTEMGDKRNDKRNIAFNQARPDKIWQEKCCILGYGSGSTKL